MINLENKNQFLNNKHLNEHIKSHESSEHKIHRRQSSTFTPRTASSDSLVQSHNQLISSDISSNSNILSHSIYSPLATIVNKLPFLTESQQLPIKRTLDLISSNSQPASHEQPTLQLAHSWTMFFSDTSNSRSNSQPKYSPQPKHHMASNPNPLLKAAEYQSGMSQVFTDVADVESLCSSLSAFKMNIAKAVRDGHLPPSPSQTGSQRSAGLSQFSPIPDSEIRPLEDTVVIPGNGLGLLVMKPGHNLHFFRAGVNPVWEDPWNEQGGRLMISTTLSMLDPTFESIVLLMAGGVLETDAKKILNVDNENGEMKEGGRVVGVVGSRRNKQSDRIEIWLSGPTVGTSPLSDWVQCIHTVLNREIGLHEIGSARYKPHYN